MSKKELETSFKNLKDTIPLLFKHKIPAVPTNYALWYTYVSNESPSLNKELDFAIDNNLPLSGSKTLDLYRNYVPSDQDVDPWKLRQSIEAMLIELNQSMTDTRKDTKGCSVDMEKCMKELDSIEQEGWSVDKAMSMVRSLMSSAETIKNSSTYLDMTLESAQKEIKRLRTQLAESQQEALYDALTGLCNRRYFNSEIESKMAMDTLSLIIVDIDHFKKINDNHGHQMGDLVIKSVARKLQERCRETAQVFRYGGEEFAVIMPNAKLSSARQLADVMRRDIEKISVKDRRTGEVTFDITVSIGVAQRQGKESEIDFIERADKQLYEAKRLGRNRVMPMHG